MLATALMLAVALNLEPTRAGVAALILMGRNPLRRSAVSCAASTSPGSIVGILVLFVFHSALISQTDIRTGQVQIFIGAAAIVIAASSPRTSRCHSRRRHGRRTGNADPTSGARPSSPSRVSTKVLSHSTKITDGSPAWVLFVLGLGCSLPSVDFMALLLLIASSGAPAVIQVGTLFMFLTLGNLATVLPLVSHRIAPEATLRKVEAFAELDPLTQPPRHRPRSWRCSGCSSSQRA